MNREAIRSLVSGSVPVFGVLALIIASAYPLAYFFALGVFSNVDWLSNLQNLFFFLPQYLFAWSMTWTAHGRVPFGVVLDVSTWILVAAVFSLATRKLSRWLSLVLAISAILATIVVTQMVIVRLGLQFQLDGP
jgi:hypothetical protein